MPRQRMVKPDFFDSGSLAECSHTARLLFIGLWVMGDDKGNNKLSLRKLKRQIFPFDDLGDDEFLDAMAQLERVGCIKCYEVDGDEYVTVPNFGVYQTVKNPSKTNIPSPPEKLAKVKRTHRFDVNANPGLTQGYTATNPQGVNRGLMGEEERGKPSTNPVQTPDEPPTGAQINKEIKKEELFFPKEKNSSPSDDSSAGVGAADEDPPTPRRAVCPLCGTPMGTTGMPDPDWWWCPHCKDSFPKAKAHWEEVPDEAA